MITLAWWQLLLAGFAARAIEDGAYYLLHRRRKAKVEIVESANRTDIKISGKVSPDQAREIEQALRRLQRQRGDRSGGLQ